MKRPARQQRRQNELRVVVVVVVVVVCERTKCLQLDSKRQQPQRGLGSLDGGPGNGRHHGLGVARERQATGKHEDHQRLESLASRSGKVEPEARLTCEHATSEPFHVTFKPIRGPD